MSAPAATGRATNLCCYSLEKVKQVAWTDSVSWRQAVYKLDIPWRRWRTYRSTRFRYTSSTSLRPASTISNAPRRLEQLQPRRIHVTFARHIYQRHAAARLSLLSCKYNEPSISLYIRAGLYRLCRNFRRGVTSITVPSARNW